MDNLPTDSRGRPMPPYDGGEAETLLGFLDFQRATFEWRCAGLDDEQLRVTLAPATMSLAGMLKHMACVEDGWFSETAGGGPMSEPWASADWDADPDWDWTSSAEDSGDELRALWAERVERSRAVVSERLALGESRALGEMHPAGGGSYSTSLRWILVHMIEEYARHNGHADLIRQSIDGETGE